MESAKVSLVVSVIFHLLALHQLGATELRYMACSTQELRTSVERTCMRLAARDGKSDLSIGPYGSIDSSSLIELDGIGVDSIKLSDADLLEVLKLSRPFHRGRKLVMNPQQQQQLQLARHSPLYKRSTDDFDSGLVDHLEACCNRSCIVDLKHLSRFCASRK